MLVFNRVSLEDICWVAQHAEIHWGIGRTPWENLIAGFIWPIKALNEKQKKHDWESLVLHVVIVSLFFKLFAYDYFRRTKCAA